MKYQEISHWSNVDNLQGLLFFAQKVDELLFDYTMDTYKPMALNARLLCIEALETIDYVRKDVLNDQNIDHIINELKWSLRRDTAAKSLVGDNIERFEDALKPGVVSNEYLISTIELLYNHFNEKKYLDEINKLIIDSILNNGKEKEKLEILISSLITELINYGYSRRHVYYQNSQFFFNQDNKISKSEQIKDFLKIFNFKEEEYTVVAKGTKLFNSFSNIFKKFDIQIKDSYQVFSKMQLETEFVENKSSEEVFLVHSKVKSLDHASALNKSYEIISQISNLLCYFYHEEKLKVDSVAVVRRDKDNYVTFLNQPVKTITKRKDIPPEYAEKKTLKILKSNSRFEQESMYRFFEAVELHGVALESLAIENQLLDLWAALETLVPRKNVEGGDRISQFRNTLIPFQLLSYNERIIKNLINDLFNWNGEKFKEIIEDTTGLQDVPLHYKVAFYLGNSEFEENRKKDLYSLLDDYPLLKYRLFSLSKNFSSGENIIEFLERHEKKFDWHLRRIYRTRNKIIHAGTSPSYTRILVGNLHDYIDLMVDNIIDVGIPDERITTIEHVILDTRFKKETYIRHLKSNKETKTNKENYIKLIFGE